MSGKIVRSVRPLSAFHFYPGSGTFYCHDCKKQKPGGPRSSRCEDCAKTLREIDAGYKMPDRAFRGTTSNFTIGHIISSHRLEREEVRALREGERRLAWFILPPFQRPAVWTAEQQVLFIESIWLDLPIGSYAYNDPVPYRHPTNAWLIDGQQRITALLDYVAGKFEAFGYRHDQLDRIERQRFENCSFPAVVVQETNETLLEEIYNRLAYGGTAHQPK